MSETPPVPQPAPAFLPGQKVSFTYVRVSGSSIRMGTREGKVERVMPDGRIVIRYRGELISQDPVHVRPMGQQSALGEGFVKVVQALAAEPTALR